MNEPIIISEKEADFQDRLAKADVQYSINSIKDLFDQCRNEYIANVFSDELKSQFVQEAYPVWVIYPWKNLRIRIVNDLYFQELQGFRNRNKITAEEAALFRTKKIGIVGLSVGHSSAVALAMEKIGGEFRISDSDVLDITNTNRLHHSFTHVGELKTDLTKRVLMEMNPFQTVKTFGHLTPESIDSWLTAGGKLDLVVEECDNIEIKIHVRLRCKALGIPVLMETSDRGMLDVERHDIEDCPIFDGKIGAEFYHTGLTPEERHRALFSAVRVSELSERSQQSMMEIGKTLKSWPQLYSDVALGGAIIAKAAKRIFLNQELTSGRRYVDVDARI